MRQKITTEQIEQLTDNQICIFRTEINKFNGDDIRIGDCIDFIKKKCGYYKCYSDEGMANHVETYYKNKTIYSYEIELIDALWVAVVKILRSRN